MALLVHRLQTNAASSHPAASVLTPQRQRRCAVIEIKCYANPRSVDISLRSIIAGHLSRYPFWKEVTDYAGALQSFSSELLGRSINGIAVNKRPGCFINCLICTVRYLPTMDA